MMLDKSHLLGLVKVRRKRHQDIDAYIQLIWGSTSLKLTSMYRCDRLWVGLKGDAIALDEGKLKKFVISFNYQLVLKRLLKSLDGIYMIHHIDATQQQIQIDPFDLFTTRNLFIVKRIALFPQVINL